MRAKGLGKLGKRYLSSVHLRLNLDFCQCALMFLVKKNQRFFFYYDHRSGKIGIVNLLTFKKTAGEKSYFAILWATKRSFDLMVSNFALKKKKHFLALAE